MPSYLKALPVILLLATVVFLVAKPAACASATLASDFSRRRNLWFAVTLIAFLAHNFWIFIVAAGMLLFLGALREQNKLAMYLALLFAVPMIADPIPGLGGIQQFFTIHYGRLLALVVLLPAFLELRNQPDTEPIGRPVSDKLLIGYIVLQFVLMLTASTFTNTLRHGVFYAFIDIFLPYYVASRGIRSLQAFRDTAMAFTVSALILAAIAAFEMSRHWLLYAALDDALGVPWVYGRYLERGHGLLRAQGTTGHSIPLGYVMAVALGLYVYVRRLVPNRTVWVLGLLLLLVGLIAPVSRGPWIGAAAMVLLYAALSPTRGRQLVTASLVGLVLMPVIFLSPAGDLIIRYLPFVGSVETENIDYRQQLLKAAVEVILQNPLFGGFNFIYSPAFQDLKAGSAGFIDVVNTYAGIGLSSGLVGLSLFTGFFGVVLVGIFTAMRRTGDRNSEFYVIGQVLLCILVGILLIIFTASSITVIPLIYWTFAGLGVAYARVLITARNTDVRTAARQGSMTYTRPASAPSSVP